MAAAIKRSYRPLTGILLVDKPSGPTSNQVLQRVRRLYQAAKAGHTGSLDPLATGMLPVCFGAATKVSGLMLDASKTYRVTARFGMATATGDSEGDVIAQVDGEPVPRALLEAEIAGMLGAIDQIPPMYSAIKQQGRRLYELARAGIEVPRASRRIHIYALELEAYTWPDWQVRVHCSKGTYVRTIVTDLAEKLGTLAHVTSLRRLSVGTYEESQMVDLAALEAMAEQGFAVLDGHLLGVDTALTSLPAVCLDSARATSLKLGQRVAAEPEMPLGEARVYGPDRRFVGIGEVLASGELKPKKIFSLQELGQS